MHYFQIVTRLEAGGVCACCVLATMWSSLCAIMLGAISLQLNQQENWRGIGITFVLTAELLNTKNLIWRFSCSSSPMEDTPTQRALKQTNKNK